MAEIRICSACRVGRFLYQRETLLPADTAIHHFQHNGYSPIYGRARPLTTAPKDIYGRFQGDNECFCSPRNLSFHLPPVPIGRNRQIHVEPKDFDYEFKGFIGVGGKCQRDGDTRRFENDSQRSGKRHKTCRTRTNYRRVSIAQGSIGSSKNRLFHALVLGEDRVHQVLSVRWAEALQA